MRMKGKCLFISFCCLLLAFINLTTKLLVRLQFEKERTTQTSLVHIGYLQTPAALKDQEILSTIKKCTRKDDSKCKEDLKLPHEQSKVFATDFAKADNDVKVNNASKDSLNSVERLHINDDFEMTTPTNFIEIKKDKPKPKSSRKKYVTATTFKRTFSYPPTKLLARINTLPNASEIVKFVEKQNDRKDFEKQYCSRHLQGENGSDVYNPQGLQSIIIDREFYLSFCPIYKAASTSWLSNMLKLKGMWRPESRTRKTQELVNQAFYKVNNLVAPWASKGTTSFMVVRHPFHRLLSCYRDKFERASKYYYYQLYGEKMVRVFRPRPEGLDQQKVMAMLNEVRRALNSNKPTSLLENNVYANPIGPTFEEFVKFVVTSKTEDDHWRPYYTQCSLCHMTYDFVLRFENLKNDSELFLNFLNQSNVIKTGWENPTAHGTTSEDVVCDYFNRIDKKLMLKLVAKYRHDFLLFNYTPDEYLKCLKDVSQ